MAYEEDVAFARRVCREIRAGNRAVIEEVYCRYHRYLVRYAVSRLYDPGSADDVMGDFWLRLVDGRILDAYQGRSALRTYLTGVLRHIILDANREMEKRRRPSGILPEDSGPAADELAAGTRADRPCRERARRDVGGCARSEGPTGFSGEDAEREARRAVLVRTVHRALLALSAVHPRCAWILWMRLCGLQYGEIARIELLTERPGAAVDPKQLGRKTNALKRLATRAEPPGCEARFKELFVKVLKNEGLEPEDVL